MRGARRDQRGAVTAETAMVLPLLLAVTIGLVWLLSLASAQVRLVDAARETARAAARGDPDSVAVQLGRRAAPPGSQLTVSRGQGRVTASAVVTVGGPGGLFESWGGVRLDAQAVAVDEEDPQ